MRPETSKAKLPMKIREKAANGASPVDSAVQVHLALQLSIERVDLASSVSFDHGS